MWWNQTCVIPVSKGMIYALHFWINETLVLRKLLFYCISIVFTVVKKVLNELYLLIMKHQNVHDGGGRDWKTGIAKHQNKYYTLCQKPMVLNFFFKTLSQRVLRIFGNVQDLIRVCVCVCVCNTYISNYK